MERVNTVIQVQCFTLALIGLCLYLIVERAINFDGTNASSAIINQMPWHFHEKYFALSLFLAFTGSIGFLASHYEIHFIASIDSILSLIALGATMLLVVATGIASNNIRGLITPSQPLSSKASHGSSSKCPFVLPQFSQE